jgi:maltose alpha-D-glucosyltransferase / alpha-amylase
VKKLASAIDLWYKDAIIYELHVRAFADSNNDGIGDFPGLLSEARLPAGPRRHLHLAAAVFPSPLRDDGYDIADYVDVNPSYGTLDDFKRFLDAAHERNMQVMIELVINHTPISIPGFRRAPRPPARRARLLRLERHRPESTRTRASSSPTPKNPTGPGIRSPRPTTGIASSRTSPT